MAYPINYAGKLNANEIFSAIFNMIISQEVFADNVKDVKSSLVDVNRVDGSMYGDTKLYYATDVLRSYAWGGDSEAQNLLAIDRPEDPQCQAITINVFRQIRLTVDYYLSKRAWSSEGAFNQFTSVMLGWMRETKRVYDATTYNAFIGSYETAEGKQSITITLPTDTDKEAENRLQAQTIATKVADIIVDVEDISRSYNDYQNLRSYSADDFEYVWNASFVNKIRKLDLPTIFHKDFIDKFAQYTLPQRYFGKLGVVSSTGAQTSDGLTYRSLVEQDVILEEAINFKGKSLPKGTSFHLFAGDVIPNKIQVASTTEIKVPFYVEDSTIVLKMIHKKAVPYMSGFEAGTEFNNGRSLTKNNYLTFGHNTLVALHDKPFITLRAVVS